jgi:hypothetical protein
MKRIKIVKKGYAVGLFILALGTLFIAPPSFAASDKGADAAPDKREMGHRVNWQKAGGELQAVLKEHAKDTQPAVLGTIQEESLPCFIEVSFSAPKFEQANAGYERIVINESGTGEPLSYWDGEPGTPRLPIWPVKLLPPNRREIVGVRVIPTELTLVEGTHKIECVQKPMPTDEPENPELTLPDPEIYTSDEPFPSYQAGNVMVQRMKGYDIFFVNLCPIQYMPASGAVSYYGKMRVELITKASLAAEKAMVKEGNLGPIPDRIEPDLNALGDVLSIVDNKADKKIEDTYK